MGYESRLIRVEDVDPEFAAAWDALPAARGRQADFHDSHAWLAAWSQRAGRGTAAALRIPAVLADGRPVALLPLEVRSRRRWESAATRAVRTHRKRYRPVLGTETPDEEAVGLLVEEVGRAGVRELSLNRLPAGDPATGALLAALRDGGYAVGSFERSCDYLTRVEGGWEGHRRRFAAYERSVRRLVKRCQPWELRLDEHGGRSGMPMATGFGLYERLHERSWKGSLTPGWRREYLALLRRAEQLGWCRIYVLWVAGIPAAAEIWFRLGQVASVPSMVYDGRLAALGPGSIVVWQAQELAFAESPPCVLDHLPGDNPLKDRIATDRPPLLIVEAVRRPIVGGASLTLRSRARMAGQAAAARALAEIRRARPRPRSRSRSRPGGRRLRLEPAPTGVPAAGLELDAPLRRFLAVTGSHRSPAAMASTWVEGDRWWRVGREPAALVRVGTGGEDSAPVREVVLVHAGPERVEELVGAVAAAMGMPLQLDLPCGDRPDSRLRPVPVHQALLPWPGGPS
jgi:Acetyltransferase (GNAT) domain